MAKKKANLPDGVPASVDLGTATTDEIFDELISRYPSGVVLAYRRKGTGSNIENPINAKGDIDTLFMLTARVLNTLNEIVTARECGETLEIEQEEDEEEDEEPLGVMQ